MLAALCVIVHGGDKTHAKRAGRVKYRRPAFPADIRNQFALAINLFNERQRIGQPITDACLGWEDTEKLIEFIADDV